MRRTKAIVALSLCLFAPLIHARADFALHWARFSAGGTMFQSAGALELSGTIGQPEAGRVARASFGLDQGFWPVILPASVQVIAGDVSDLVISINENADPVLINAPVTWTITVSNRGPATATGVVLTNMLPAGLTLVSAAALRPITMEGQAVVCTVGTLHVGASVEVELVARSESPNLFVVSASAHGDQSDPNRLDNLAAQATTVASRLPQIFVWTGSASQDWGNELNWSPQQGIPSLGDTAIISGGTVLASAPVDVGVLQMLGGSLSIQAPLRVGLGFEWTAGYLLLADQLTLMPGSTGSFSGGTPGWISGGGTFNTRGDLLWNGNGTVYFNHGTWNNSGTITIIGDAVLADGFAGNTDTFFNNSGILRKVSANGSTGVHYLSDFTNTGLLEWSAGSLDFYLARFHNLRCRCCRRSRPRARRCR